MPEFFVSDCAVRIHSYTTQ